MKKFNINVIQVVNEPLVENKVEHKRSTVKLPDIRLPTFSGKFDDWLDFKNSFTALIVDDESLSDTHKLQYLRSCLKDEAINVQSEDETFQSLWTALKNMYENKRYIINKHIEDLLTIKSMAKGSSMDLRNILNQAKKHYRALSSFDSDINQLTEVFIIHLITNKLDFTIRKDFELSLEAGKLPEWDKNISYLEVRLNTLESYEQMKKITITTTSDKKSNSTTSDKKLNSKVFTLTKESDNRPKQLKCYVCQKPHYLTSCDQFLQQSLDERLDTVKNHKLCYNCLSRTHQIQDCRSSSCKTCNKRHHTLLHKEDTGTKEYLHFSTFNKQVVLHTAVIKIQDVDGKFHFCRCLVDSGAMSNYISQSLLQILRLNTTKQNISVCGINDLTTNIKQKVSTRIESRISRFRREL
jgi:hypothetical protein